MPLSRPTRNRLLLVLQAALLVAALGLFQLVAERTNRRIDLTPGHALSLSPVTRKVLARVDQPLTITAFHRRGDRAGAADLLRRMQLANPKLAYHLFDLDRYPDRARSLGVTQYGRAVIEYQGRRAIALALPEEQLTGGILQVLRGRRRRLVFTSGHGERAPGGGDASYGRLVAALEAESYTADTVSLVEGELPPDTDALVVAGPRHDFLPGELAQMMAYLQRGGGVVLLLDPSSLPNVAVFLSALGVRLGNDFIVDRERRVLGTDGLAAIVELFKRGNPITDPSGNPIETGVVLPSARSIDVAAEVPGVRAEAIARTAATAWAVADPARARRGEEPSKAHDDVPGGAPVMVMAEVSLGGNGSGGRHGRVVVIGDADFASDAYLDLLGNRDLAMNAVAWVAGEEELAGVRPKKIPEILRPLSPLVLTETQARRILLAVVVVQPGLVLALGLALAARRRRRG